MTTKTEPKVTKCWTLGDEDGNPSMYALSFRTIGTTPAIIMWREDYDALLKELEELRKRCRYELEPGAHITCWDEYERVRRELDNVKMKLEQAEFLANSTLEENRKLWKELGASTWTEITEAHDEKEAK